MSGTAREQQFERMPTEELRERFRATCRELGECERELERLAADMKPVEDRALALENDKRIMAYLLVRRLEQEARGGD